MNDRKDTDALEDQIAYGLDALDVSYGDEAIGKLADYLLLLQEWNKTHNLTAVDDLDEMLPIHIFDSASIRPYIKGATLLDVGSGAGLPGMILAILSPALEVTSVEARNKKAQFQMFAANKLRLKNFTVINGRWLAMKGVMPSEELKALKKSNLKFDTYALKVPNLDAQRNLVVISAPKKTS